MSERERLLTLSESADELGMTERWMRRRVERKEVEYVKLGGLVRIPESELDRLVERGRVPATTPEKMG